MRVIGQGFVRLSADVINQTTRGYANANSREKQRSQRKAASAAQCPTVTKR